MAKARGVKRSMRGDEARKICRDLECIRVPVVRGKADLSKYRNAGKQVAAVLQTFTPLMTRASVDEAYLDLTDGVNNRLSDMNNVSFTRDISRENRSELEQSRCPLFSSGKIFIAA